MIDMHRDAMGRWTKDTPTAWKKGVSANPSGRPKGTISLTTRVKRTLDQRAKDVPWCASIARTVGVDLVKYPDTLVAEVYAASIIFHGAKGEAAYAKMAFDRIDGPVAQRVEVMPGMPDDLEQCSDAELIRIASGEIELG